MKKYVGFLIVLLMFFVSTPVAKAYSLDDLYASIQSLQQQVSGLQSQMSATALTAITPTLTLVIAKGTTSTEVTAIQTALKDLGYPIVADGKFGTQTESAVKTYQASVNLPVTGIVNSATKTSILSAATTAPVSTSATSVTAVAPTPTVACLPTTAPWIKVVSPNGGETFTAGQQVTVSWKSCNIPTDHEIAISLRSYQLTDTGMSSTSLLDGTPNDGQEVFALLIPTVWQSSIYGSGTRFKIELFDKDNINVGSDLSNNLFTINQITTSNLPAGCISSVGYSSTTGISCGCNGTVYNTYNGQLCPTTSSACTDSDGGLNLSVAGVAYDAVNNNGPYTDQSVSVNGGTCSGLSCTGVTERYCKNGTLDKFVYQCPPGIYSVSGACVLN